MQYSNSNVRSRMRKKNLNFSYEVMLSLHSLNCEVRRKLIRICRQYMSSCQKASYWINKKTCPNKACFSLVIFDNWKNCINWEYFISISILENLLHLFQYNLFLIHLEKFNYRKRNFLQRSIKLVIYLLHQEQNS